MSDATDNLEVRAGLAEVEAFDVVGLSTMTQQETAADDINALWENFFKNSMMRRIPNKVDDVIYAVYSDYEGDHEAPYRITIGYRVDKTDSLFMDTHHVHIEGRNYAVMSAAGEQPDALLETWEAIWSSDLDRTFKTDFEAYGPRFFEEGVHEILVHIGVNA